MDTGWASGAKRRDPRLRSRRHRSLHPRGAFLRVRAALAGALVLGVGAFATLAAWTDDEWATATVTSGRFGIVGSISGGAFADHPTSPGGSLSFTPVLSGVYPGSPAGFTTVQIRTASAASGGFDSVPGVVRMQTTTSATGNLAAALVYAVRVVPSGSSCNEALFSNASAPVIVANATALSTDVPSTPDAPQALQAAGANTVTFCIRIALPSTAPDNAQNLTTSVTWRFAGSTP